MTFQKGSDWLLDTVMKDYLQMIYTAAYHEDKIVLTARGFTELFPFSGVHLYSYSPLSEIIEGILQITDQGTSPLKIRDDVRNLPLLRKAIRIQQAVYAEGSELIRLSPEKYLKMEFYKSFVLAVPIPCNTTVVGYACPGQYTGSKPIGGDLLQALTLYGQLAGKAIRSMNPIDNPSKLSDREIAVLQRMSFGESVKEMSEFMGISQFTVQDYVKSVTKKMTAHNRVQAVAEAIRQGIIK